MGIGKGIIIGCSLLSIVFGACQSGGKVKQLPPVAPSVPVQTSVISSDPAEIFKGVKVTFLGNAGFLITVNDKKVIIDGLFIGYAGQYTVPSYIVQKSMNCEPPFDSVDLVLVTHEHEDHYGRASIRRFLTNNQKTVFATTAQVSAKFSDFSGRIATFHAEKGKPDVKQFGDIRVEAYALPHGSPSSGEPENYGYVVTIDGISFFHTGDMDSAQFSFEEFRANNFPEKKLAFAIMQHFYLIEGDEGLKYVKEGIKASYVIPGHYAFTEPPFSRELILKNLPEAVLFNKELDSWIMP